MPSRFSLLQLIKYLLIINGLVIVSLASFLIYKQYASIKTIENIIQHPFQVSNAAREIRANTRTIWDNTHYYLYHNQNHDIDIGSISMYREKNYYYFQVLKTEYLGNQNDVNELYKMHNQVNAIVDSAINISKTQSNDEAIKYIENIKGMQYYKYFFAKSKVILDFASNKSKELEKNAKESYYETIIYALVVSVILFLIMLALGYYLIKYLNKEFEKINLLVNQINKTNVESLTEETTIFKEFYSMKSLIYKMGNDISKQNQALMLNAKEIEENYDELDTSYEELSRTSQMYLTENAKYQAIMKFATDGVHILDLNGNVIECSDSFANMLGYTQEEAYRLNVTDWDATMQKDTLLNFVKELVNQTKRFETKHTRKDGSIFDVEITSSGIYINDVLYLYASSRDISKEKTVLKALTDERNLFSDGPVITIQWSPTTNWPIQYISSNSKNIFGYTAEEMIDSSFVYSNMIHPDDISRVFEEVSYNIQHEINTFEQSYRLKNKEGIYKWFYDFTKFDRDENKNITTIRGYLFDQTNLKQIEDKLKDSEFRWKFAVDGSGDGLWDWKLATNKVFFSTRWKQMLGYADDEITDNLEEWQNRVHPDDLQNVIELIQKHLRNETANYKSEHRMLCKNGEYKWILDRGIVVQRDSNNNPLRMIGTHSDIDNAKIANDRIQKAETKFHALFEESLDGIALLDLKTQQFIEFNNKTLEMYGYNEEEFKQITPKDLDAIHDLEQIKRVQNNIIEKGWDRFDTKHKTKDGSILDISVNARKIELDDKVLLYVAFHDITERKIVEQKLNEQKKELETIFETTNDGIAIMDLQTNFLDFNSTYLKQVGYEREELIKMKCLDLTLPEDIQKSKLVIDRVKEIGSINDFEKTCFKKDGSKILVNMSMALMPDKKRLVVTAKDITKNKLFEEQARLASMGEMIGNIAHQWRQPLSVISTIASGTKISSEFGDNPNNILISDMDAIVKQTQYLSKTIDDFRNFIKNDQTKHSISIANTLNKTISIIQSSLKNNHINLISNIQDDLLIDGYENELIQAFINIINNAKDALIENMIDDDSKFIFISTYYKNDILNVSIKDAGGGISKDALSRIYEPYFTTKHQSVGTGLGLSMAYKIITEHHKATIKAVNEEYQHNQKNFIGANFIISFEK